MKVFVNYSSRDQERGENFATAPLARAIDVWLDTSEVKPGDSVVTVLSDALDKADAAVVLFSQHHENSPWMKAEWNCLLWAQVEEQKRIIPVVLDPGVKLPALIRPQARRGIEDVAGVEDALCNPPQQKLALGTSATNPLQRVTIALNEHGPIISKIFGGLTKR
jgi:hypothetical protein